MTTSELAPGFALLRVARVESLTSDSVALTFDVPADDAERFRFSPGQHLTLRRVVDGQDLRRTYSVCSSAAGTVRYSTISAPSCARATAGSTHWASPAPSPSPSASRDTPG